MVTSRRLALLRISVSLVLGAQAAVLLARPVAGRLPPALLVALAALELLAALLLLVPKAVRPGALLLLVALAGAAALHLGIGQSPPPAFLICAAALWAVLPEKKRSEDDQLLAAFQDTSLPDEKFHHREHLRVAFLCLRRERDLARAALRFRRALKRYARAHGKPNLFHETITWAYLALINERMRGEATSEEFLAANPDLLSHREGLLSRYYDVAAITQSNLAREVFQLPGRRE